MATSSTQADVQQDRTDAKRDENLGVYLDLFSARTSVEGQDGGVVTSLLLKGFQERLFDAAIVVRRMDGYSAEAAVARNAEEVLAARGTKYFKVNVTKKLRELIAEGKKRIAIVCTPCEAAVARKIQQTIGKQAQITIIGLFCFEAFNSAKLKEAAKASLGVDLDGAGKTQVRNGKFTAGVEGREVSCKVKELDCAAEAACGFCGDFTSEQADVSVGSVGSKPGYSTVVVHSDVGAKLVSGLDAQKCAVDKREVARLAKFKKERAKKSLSEQKSR